MFSYISQRTEIVRSFYDGIGKTAIIYPSALLTALGLGLANLGIVFFARDIIEASPAAIGWLAGTWAVAYTIGCLSLRPVLGRFLPRYLMITSLLLMFSFILLLQFVSTLSVAFVVFALYGVSMSMFWPPLMAWLSTGAEGAALGRRFSRFNIMWCIGNTVSPYACGWLAERSARYPPLLGCVVFLLTAAFVGGAATVLPKAGGSRSTPEPLEATGDNGDGETSLRFPAWVGLFTSFFGLGAVLVAFPLAARSELGAGESVVGVVFLLRSLLSGVAFFFIGKTVFWHFRSLPMLTGQLLSALCFVCLCFSHTVVPVAIFFALLGAFGGLSYSVSMFHGVSGSANRAKRMAVHESTLAFGIICGSASAGMLYNVSSMTHVYWLCAAVIFVGAAIQWALCVFCRDHRKLGDEIPQRGIAPPGAGSSQRRI